MIDSRPPDAPRVDPPIYLTTAARGWHPPAEPHVYSVPRRFDMATLLTVSLAYSILFAILKGMDASWVVFLYLGGLTVAVGVAQALAERSAQVRKASMITGGIYCIAMGGILLAAAPMTSGERVLIAFCLVTGPGIGYLAGALDGGLFLVADMVRRHLPDGTAEFPSEATAEDPAGEQPPAD